MIVKLLFLMCQKLNQSIFNELYTKVKSYYNSISKNDDVYIFDGFGGDDLKYTLPKITKIINKIIICISDFIDI